MSVIERIRAKIRARDYYLSSHAEEELAEDGFERADAEHVILNGLVEKKLTHDPRGTRYRVMGNARDGRQLAIICRFKESVSLLIITGYLKE